MYLNSCPDFFGLVGKGLDKRAKFHVKSYDVTDLATSNYSTPIAQYFKK